MTDSIIIIAASVFIITFCLIILLPKIRPIKKTRLVSRLVRPVTRLFLARQQARLRSKAGKGLEQVIDLLRLYLSAGQNLESAWQLASLNVSGFWREQLKSTVFRLQLGLPFEQVLAEVGERLGLPEIKRLLITIKQARLLGTPLNKALAVQASLLRTRRKQRAEEQARAAAVKIALPLVLCIFPALLIIYLAPAVLKVFSGL